MAAIDASMGPRLFRRGNTVQGALRRKDILASMGPRLFRRGNNRIPNPEPYEIAALQWGHVFSDVEIRDEETILPGHSHSFNGATSFQTWKSDLRFNLPPWENLASMGPRLFRRGND